MVVTWTLVVPITSIGQLYTSAMFLVLTFPGGVGFIMPATTGVGQMLSQEIRVISLVTNSPVQPETELLTVIVD